MTNTARRWTDGGIWVNPSSCKRHSRAEEIPHPIAEQAYARETEPVLAWPTLERLAHAEDRRRVAALLYWRDLCQPADRLAGTIGDDSTNTEYGMEIRPTEPALLQAIGWRVAGKVRWPHTGKRVRTYDPSDAEPVVVPEKPPAATHIKLGDLRFHSNELVEWGRDAKGRPLAPIERPAQGESGSSTTHTVAAVWRYLRLRGAVPRPSDVQGLERVPCSSDGAGGNGSYYDPLPGVEEARAILAKLMETAPPITYCPPGLVSGKQWVGGRPRCRNDAPGAATGTWDAKTSAGREMARVAEESRLRSALGSAAAILDMSITDATAKQIGEEQYTASSAEKYGAAFIDRALDKLIVIAELQHALIAANDNDEISQKAAA